MKLNMCFVFQTRRGGDGRTDATPVGMFHHQPCHVHSVARRHADYHGRRPFPRPFFLFPFDASVSKRSSISQVECNADVIGRFEEDLVIDISGRDQNDHPTGIPYRLIGEACIPSVNITDVGSIFEEHRICRNLSVWQHLNAVSSSPRPPTSLLEVL